MVTKNKIGTFFGPSGIASGWAFLFAGIGICWFSLLGIFLIAVGAFLAFSSSSVILDPTNKQIRPIYTIIGILPIGKWIKIDSSMFLSVKPNNRIYRTYSRSNRHSDVKTHNFSIVLNNKKQNSLIPLRNFRSAVEANTEATLLSMEFGIEFKK